MDEIGAVLWAATLKDPFVTAWPVSFINSLNTNVEEAASEYRRRVATVRKGKISAREYPNANVKKLRQQQRELRALVDRYIKGGDVDAIVRELRQKLDREPYRAVVATPSDAPHYSLDEGARAFLRFTFYNRPGRLHLDDWLGFARLLASPLADRLTQCLNCDGYFLATKRGTQKYCSQKCGWTSRRHSQVTKDSKGYLLKERERVKGYRQLKQQQPK